MRFLIDECLPQRAAAVLAAAGHDVVHTLDRLEKGSPDTEVMAVAVGESRILVSADTDFGELLAASKEVAPSVILLRGFAGRPDRRVQVLLDNLDQLQDDLDNGAIVVVGEERIRVRALPIG